MYRISAGLFPTSRRMCLIEFKNFKEQDRLNGGSCLRGRDEENPFHLMLKFLIRVFIIAVWVTGVEGQQEKPYSQLDALHDLFSSTGGPSWRNKTGWSDFERVFKNSSAWDSLDPCSTVSPWTGINCTALSSNNTAPSDSNRSSTNSVVTAIALPSNNLKGPFPKKPWSGLTSLQIIDLDFNELNQSAPTTLCLLADLQSLSARGNSMDGSLPECIDSCSRLTSIDFSSEAPGLGGVIINHYTMSLNGSLPHSICNLPELVRLRFQGTYGLTGSIPPCLAANQSSLSVVDLHGNMIVGTIPEALSTLTNLVDLDLGNNTITGSIPVSIVKPALTFLDLSMNRITGVMPHNVGDNLPTALALEKVYLYNNSITGSIPDSFGRNNPFLEIVDLHMNNLAGPIPNSLCEIGHNLGQLKLSSNQFTGTIPDCLAKGHPKLSIIDMSENSLVGHIPSICDVSFSLNTLALVNNSLTGTIPDCQNRTGWPLLENLLLSNNKLQGTLPSHICESAVRLDRLEIETNFLRGTIPSCYGTSFPQLRSLFLHNNKLHGRIDFEWALGSLNALILSNNPKLKGALPSSIFSQQGGAADPADNFILETVVVEGTQVTGKLPSAVCGAANLRQLALSGNYITGSIPHCLFSMKTLETFHMADNLLTGTIPSSVGGMESLTEMNVGNNHLEGKMPKQLGELSPQINQLNFQLNFMSCDLPRSVLHWKKSEDFNEVDMLSGNLFGCSKSEMTAEIDSLSLSVSRDCGLAKADVVATAFVCADKGQDALNIATALSVVLPSVLAFAWLWYIDGFHLSAWYEMVALVTSTEGQEIELQRAAQEMVCLTLSVCVIALVGILIVLPLAVFADSPFTCQYFAKFTVGYKRFDEPTLSFGLGCSIVLGLLASLGVWFRRYLTSAGRVEPRVSRFSVIIGRAAMSAPAGGLERVSEVYSEESDEQEADFNSAHDGTAFSPAYDSDAIANQKNMEDLMDSMETEEMPEPDIEDIPEEDIRQAWSLVKRSTLKEKSLLVANVVLRVAFVCALSLGPNFLYVWLTTNKNITSSIKEYGLVAITLFKIYLTTAVLPFMSRSTVDLVVPPALAAIRFHSRTTTTVVLFVIAGIVIPIIVILATDPRCFYHQWIESRDAETNNVYVPSCSFLEEDGSCSQFTDVVTQSTYKQEATYSGAKCVASVLFIYVPVFQCGVFFTALVPALLELVIVPLVAPWCYTNRHSSAVATKGLWILRTIALNVSLHIPHEDLSTHRSRVALRSIAVAPGVDGNAEAVRESDVSPFVTRVNYLARRVAERGFSQITITLLISLTFGIAAPWISLIGALSALLQLVHHLVLLKQVQEQFEDYLFIQVPFFVPWTVGATVTVTTLIFWLVGSFKYLDSSLLALGGAIMMGFVGVTCLLLKAFFCRTHQNPRPASLILSPLLMDGVPYEESTRGSENLDSGGRSSAAIRTTSV